jgi:hypothetical protein
MRRQFQFVVGNRAILTAEIHSRAMQDQTGMNPEDERFFLQIQKYIALEFFYMYDSMLRSYKLLKQLWPSRERQRQKRFI